MTEANDAAPKGERGSQAIHRALSVLECFTVDSPTVSLTQITHQVGLTMPTAHRIVKALQTAGFVTRDALTNRYSLGPSVMSLARVMMQRGGNEELVAAAMPYLERLRTRTGETVGLHSAISEGRYCVAELVSRHPIKLSTGVGHTYDLYVAATGKAILAFSDQATSERVFANLAKDDGTGPFKKPHAAQLKRELVLIRQRGYATTMGEVVATANSIAAPILSDRGYAVAAINITGPGDRWTPQLMEQYAPDLLEITREVSARLGHDLGAAPATTNGAGAVAPTRTAKAKVKAKAKAAPRA